MMKILKTLILLPILMICATLHAQTQEGYVKTRGRVVNGQHVKGTGLPGATVIFRSRQPVVVQKQNGFFSFPYISNKYIVDSVIKKGYQIVDVDCISREQQYSKNPIYLVMEKPDQQLTDKLHAEKKIRKVLQCQLHERENEIDSLKELNKITIEEYNQLLQKLYSEQESNEKLIQHMAETYSKMDYDQMDGFYLQVASFIDNGDLVSADSLLRTRGDVNQQVIIQIKKGTAIRKEKEKLLRAETVYQETNEELSRRCYAFHENFLLQHKIDSAAHYLKLRAQLDSTNIEWQNDYGEFILEYLADYSKSLESFKRNYNLSVILFGSQSEWGVISLNNIGLAYDAMGNDSLALAYFKKSLATSKEISDYYNDNVATCLNNIGHVYYSQRSNERALLYYEEAMEIYKTLYGIYDTRVAMSYNNIGSVFTRQEKYDEAVECYNKSLEIFSNLHANLDPDVATCLNNLGSVYSKQGDSLHALQLFEQSLNKYKLVYTDEHPKVATTLNNIGYVYSAHHNYEQALNYYFSALNIWRSVSGAHHPDVANCYNNIAHVYEKKMDYSNALDYFYKALEIYRINYGELHHKVVHCIEAIRNINSHNSIEQEYNDNQNNHLRLQKEDSSNSSNIGIDKDVELSTIVKEKIMLFNDYLMFMTNKDTDLQGRLEYVDKALSLFMGNGNSYIINGDPHQPTSITVTSISTNCTSYIKPYLHGLATLGYEAPQKIKLIAVDYYVIPRETLIHMSDNTYQCVVYQYTYNIMNVQELVYKDKTIRAITCQVTLEEECDKMPHYIVLLGDIHAVIK